MIGPKQQNVARAAACSLPFDASGALIARQGWLALPGPAPLDLQRERPAEERANQHQASEQAQTEESQLMRDRLYDVGRDKDFQAQQQRSPDADLVNVGILQGDGLSQL